MNVCVYMCHVTRLAMGSTRPGSAKYTVKNVILCDISVKIILTDYKNIIVLFISVQ